MLAWLGIVPVSTDQIGEPQDSQDIRYSTRKNLAPPMNPRLSIALGQTNKSSELDPKGSNLQVFK